MFPVGLVLGAIVLAGLGVDGSFDDFNPKTAQAYLTYTVTITGSSLTTADQISVVQSTTSANVSSLCAHNGGVPAATVGGPTYLYQTSTDGLSGTATIIVTQPGSHRVCALAAQASTWSDIGQFNILTANAPTVTDFTTENPDSRTSSGTGNAFKALRYHPFTLSLTGTGLVVGSSVQLRWTQGNSGCGVNSTIVSGGGSRILSTANTNGTQGTATFTLTDSPLTAMSLCFRHAGGSFESVLSAGNAVTAASLKVPEVTGWFVSPVASVSGTTFTVDPNTDLTLSLRGTELLGEEVQAACAEAVQPFSICIKIATDCTDGSDVSDIVGGDAVVPAMNASDALAATFSFSIPSGTTAGVLCTRSAGGGSWTAFSGQSVQILAPSVSGFSPSSVSSNEAFSLTLNGTLFPTTGADTAMVKLAEDCSINTLSDTVGVVQGGEGRACDSVSTFASVQQCQITYSAGIAALASTTVQVCLRFGSGAYAQASSGSGFALTLSPITATGATLPALITSNAAATVTVTGQALAATGGAALKLKIASDCAVDSSTDTSDIPGGTGKVVSAVTASTSAVASFTIAVPSNQSVVVCWAVAYSVSYAQVGSSAPVDAVTVTSFTPAAAFSMRQFTLRVTGSKLGISGDTAIKVKVAFDCTLDTSEDNTGVVLGGAGAVPTTLTSSSDMSTVLALSTMLSVPEAQVCWRVGSLPYQRITSGVISVSAATASSFTPTVATSLSAVTLTVTGSFGLQGDALYAKMATDCRTYAYGDATGTVPGSESTLAQKFSNSFFVTFTMAVLSTTSLQLCWRTGSSPYLRVGSSTLTVSPITASAITPSTVISNVPTQVTIIGTGFVSTPSNLLVRLKLSEDCSLYANSDQSTCGTGNGDCVYGGTGVAQAGTADGQFAATFDIEVAVFNNMQLQLCWVMNTPPYQYVQIPGLQVDVQVPMVQVAAVVPPNPYINEPFTLSLTGEGLTGSVPIKLKLSHSCDGLLDRRPLELVSGGSARFLSCITDATAASVDFTVLSNPQSYLVCVAPGDLGNGGSWAPADTSLLPPASFALRLPTVTSAAVVLDAPPAANVPFTVSLQGRGFGDGEKVKVKVVARGTSCGFPFTPLTSAPQGCTCDAQGVPSNPASCVCVGSNSDFEGVVPGGDAKLIQPQATNAATVSLTVREIGDFTVCWSVGDLSRTGTSYLPALNFSASPPYASCVGPPQVYLGAQSELAVVGYGLSVLDSLKLVWTADGSCEGGAIPGLDGTVQATADPFGNRALYSFGATTAAYTSQTFQVCHRYANSQGGYVRVGNILTALEAPTISSYTPTVAYQNEGVTVAIVGAGLSSGQRAKIVQFNQQCSAASPTVADGGGAIGLTCSASVQSSHSDVTCTARFTITQQVSTTAAQNNLKLCYSYATGTFVDVGGIQLRLPAVTSFTPTTVYAGETTTLTLQGEGLRSTLAKRIKLVAMHAQCAGSSDTDDVAGGGEAAVLPVGAEAGTVSLGLTLLAGTSGRSRVCYRAGSQAFAEIGQLVVASPLPTSAFPMLYAEPAPRSAVPAGVPFQLAVQGQGLQAPGLLVKILPHTTGCFGTIDTVAGVVPGGEGRALTAGVASFAGITQLGMVKVCIKGEGWPSFTEVPDSVFNITSSFSTSSVFPTSIVEGILTRVTVDGTGLIPDRLTLAATIRQGSCNVGPLLAGGEQQMLVDDDGGQGRKAYVEVAVSNAQAGATHKLCLKQGSQNETEAATLTVLAQPSVVIHQTTAPLLVPFHVALSGFGLSPVAMLKFITPTAVCSGIAGAASQNASIVSGGQAKQLMASSVDPSGTAAVSAAFTLDAASIKACFAAGPGSTFTDLQTYQSPSNLALLTVAEYAPVLEFGGSSSPRMSVVRGAPASFLIYGTGVQAGDTVVINRGPCPTDSTTPSQDVIASFDAVAGGEARQLTALNASVSTCGYAGFSASFVVAEVGSDFRLCYVPAGLAVSLQLTPDAMDVTLPALHAVSPKLTYANRRQVFNLTGSGGYSAGDKVKLINAYGGSGFTVTSTCRGETLDDESSVPGGNAYTVTTSDVRGTTLSVTFTVAEAWVVLRLCYLPVGATAYQDVGTSEQTVEVRAPQVSGVPGASVTARDAATLRIDGNGLSVDDRFKIIPPSGVCEGSSDTDGSVLGGEGRSAESATPLGNQVAVPFELATSAIGEGLVCFRHSFSCEYALAGHVTVLPPSLTALGDASQDGNALNLVLVNRDSILRVNGIGLSSDDMLRVVAVSSACEQPAGTESGWELFGEATLFSVDAARSSALVRLNLRSHKREGRLCFRFCDAPLCAAANSNANTSRFVDTGIVLPLVQPQISAVTPENMQVDTTTSVTVTGSSLTAQDRVKIVSNTAECAGFDDHSDVLTGGNGRTIIPLQDCNQQPEGAACTAVASFRMTYEGYGKLCFTSSGGAGYREAAGIEGQVEICSGVCLSNVSWPDFSLASVRASAWPLHLLAAAVLGAILVPLFRI